ncbi:MAG: hypothetical protein JSV62_12845 [Promethearchaeota archaeon]|nr:MAG: hypothetical protein JSV62_12845 [Candidatus Lokiarchaeota archaeon]
MDNSKKLTKELDRSYLIDLLNYLDMITTILHEKLSGYTKNNIYATFDDEDKKSIEYLQYLKSKIYTYLHKTV